MKIKFIYALLCLCALLFLPMRAAAQTCNPDFTVNTQITNSTCQSNGEITVTLSGDNIAGLINIQYGLTSTTSGGFTINPQSDPVLRNIPPGTYELSVRAFCQNDASFDVLKKVTGLVVGGNYTVPVPSFNTTASRKSYVDCPSGIIALNVTGGTGNFTFTITSAPAGVATPMVLAAGGINDIYTLPNRDFPAGDYVIRVDDECYSAVCSFTLGGLSGFPSPNVSGGRFSPADPGNSCSLLKWSPGAVANSSEYFSHYENHLYEISLAPVGEEPTTWYTWTNHSLTFDTFDLSLLAYTGVRAHVRLKECPDVNTYFGVSFYDPSINVERLYDCDYELLKIIHPITSGYALFCYPLSIRATKTSTSEQVYNLTGLSYPLSETLQLEYGVRYSIVVTDAKGSIINTITETPSRRDINLNYIDNICAGKYTLSYNIPGDCYPIETTIKDSKGNVVCSNTVAGNNSYYCTSLIYGENYTFEAVYAGSTGYTYTTTISRESGIPTAYALSQYTSDLDNCREYYGRLRIAKQNGTVFVAGTKYTITGPEGYTTQTGTLTSGATTQSVGSTNVYLPPGRYTVTIINGCGDQTPITATYNHPGTYSGSKLSYTTESDCSGLKVTPSGYVTYQGTDRPNNTYYRLISGPAGYDTSVKTPGDSFILYTPGNYVLAISVNGGGAGCSLARDTIEFTSQLPFSLDTDATSAYVCVGETIGNITIKAQNGVAPYTYELWNEANTIKLASDIVTSGAAHFNYGTINESYMVRISDGCGNSFNQRVSLIDLATARIVHSTEPGVCLGNTIFLKCITLGNTAYTWTGPNGFTSTEQNPEIPNAQQNMEGWYKVSVMPEYCGMAVSDSIYISIYTSLTAGATNGDQTVCVGSQPSVLRSETTGGNGIYTYRWQSSPDGVSDWTDISGATQDTYQPPIQTQSGTYYYRKTSANVCGTVNSGVITVVVKSCNIPVNRHVRSRAKKS